jgi:hypothetical protein
LAIQAAQGDGICSRIGEQGANRSQLTVGLTQSTQCLYTRDTAGSGIDERLKAGERLPVDHKASLVDLVFGLNLATG